MSTSSQAIIDGKPSQPVKIGFSKDTPKRVKSLQTGNPRKLVLCATYRTPAAPDIEKMIHEQFDEERLHGEWFSSEPRVAYQSMRSCLRRSFARFAYSQVKSNPKKFRTTNISDMVGDFAEHMLSGMEKHCEI